MVNHSRLSSMPVMSRFTCDYILYNNTISLELLAHNYNIVFATVRSYVQQLICTFFPYSFVQSNTLKESLHIILMTIVFLEINQLHSLGYGQMITKEKIYERLSLRVQLSYNIQ